MSDILQAVDNLTRIKLQSLKESYLGSNRINNQGEALELLVKDIFSGSINTKSLEEKELNYE